MKRIMWLLLVILFMMSCASAEDSVDCGMFFDTPLACVQHFNECLEAEDIEQCLEAFSCDARKYYEADTGMSLEETYERFDIPLYSLKLCYIIETDYYEDLMLYEKRGYSTGQESKCGDVPLEQKRVVAVYRTTRDVYELGWILTRYEQGWKIYDVDTVRTLLRDSGRWDMEDCLDEYLITELKYNIDLDILYVSDEVKETVFRDNYDYGDILGTWYMGYMLPIDEYIMHFPYEMFCPSGVFRTDSYEGTYEIIEGTYLVIRLNDKTDVTRVEEFIREFEDMFESSYGNLFRSAMILDEEGAWVYNLADTTWGSTSSNDEFSFKENGTVYMPLGIGKVAVGYYRCEGDQIEVTFKVNGKSKTDKGTIKYNKMYFENTGYTFVLE